mgnify:CR=1 FL=1
MPLKVHIPTPMRQHTQGLAVVVVVYIAREMHRQIPRDDQDER